MCPSTRAVILVLGLAIAAPASVSAQTAQYTAVDLGSLGGTYSDATDVNDARQVVGTSELPNRMRRGFIWDEVNGMRDLGDLGGVRCQSLAMNEWGDVVGKSLSVENVWRAFLWTEPDGILALPIPQGDSSRADDINDLGEITGHDGTYAYVWNESSGTQTPRHVGRQVQFGEEHQQCRAGCWTELSGLGPSACVLLGPHRGDAGHGHAGRQPEQRVGP